MAVGPPLGTSIHPVELSGTGRRIAALSVARSATHDTAFCSTAEQMVAAQPLASKCGFRRLAKHDRTWRVAGDGKAEASAAVVETVAGRASLGHHRMKIATFNVNGVNGRLPVLLRWLDEAAPDVVCLQELKAPQERFPLAAIDEAGYGAIWHGQKSWNGVAILARGAEPIETRRGPAGRSGGHAQPLYRGGGRRRPGRLPLPAPNGNPAPGPKFDYKLAGSTRLDAHAAELLEHRRTGRAGRRLQRHADRSRRLQAGALARRRPVPAGGARGLRRSRRGRAGRTRCAPSIRTSASTRSGTISGTPGGAMPVCGSTTCCSAPRSPTGLSMAASTATCAGWEKASDHAPAWIELKD